MQLDECMKNENDINHKKKLTEREKRFCEKYVLCLNGSKAAREAGYSEKSCRQISEQNLSKLHIRHYIKEIQKDIETLCGINKSMVVLEHKKIAFSSFSNIHDTWIERKEFESIKENNPEILDCIQEIETKIQSNVQYVKIKLYSKQNSLDSISKMLGYNAPEKTDITTKGESLNKITSIEVIHTNENSSK